jgi:hypothetical protein
VWKFAVEYPQRISAWVISLFLLLTAIGLAANVSADDVLNPGYTRDYVQEVLNESVNTTTLFAAHELISNGRFLRRRIYQPDTKYEMFRLPVELLLTDRSDAVRPFIKTGFGLLKVTGGATSIDGQGESDFSVTKSFTLISGAGVYIDLADGLSIAPAVMVSYTHLNNQYDFNNPFSQDVLQGQFGDFYNWNLDLLTYTPQLRVIYQAQVGPGRFRYTLSASQLVNDSFHSTSANVKINSSSGLVSNRFEYQKDMGVSLGTTALALQPFFQWGYISGKAASGLNFVNMYEIGADLIFSLKEKLAGMTEIYVGASYVSADSFEGYHVGLGAHF